MEVGGAEFIDNNILVLFLLDILQVSSCMYMHMMCYPSRALLYSITRFDDWVI